MKYQRILLDIETQREFFQPGGSYYTPSAPKVARNIYRLFSWARNNRAPVISTVLRVRTYERGPLGAVPHCIEESDGERKLSRTVCRNRVNLGLRNTTDLPGDLFDNYQQVVFEKRHTDLFAHCRAERLITELPPVTFIVCGAGVTHGIVQATIGLRSRGFGVIVASDAVLDLGDPLAGMAYLRMEAKGAILAPTCEIIAPTPQRRARPYRRSAASCLHRPVRRSLPG